MNIIEKEENLKEILLILDDQLADFKELVFDMISYKLDYSIESVKYVELILKHLGKRVSNNAELQREAALYIGQTFKSHFNGIWQVFDKENST